MAEPGALEELQSELTCPVCLEIFRDPVILECGHHFCQVCIVQCWEAKADEQTTCPKCRKTCARKLRPNSLLCNVVDSVRAPTPPGWDPEDDQLPICLVCGMSRDHKTHNVIPINEAFENYKVSIYINIMVRHCNFKKYSGDLEEMVSAEFDHLREFLQEEEDRIKQKLQKQKEEKLAELEGALTEATQQISQLESTADQLRLKLTEEENPEQLKVRQRKCLCECISLIFVAVTAVSLDPDTAYPCLWVSLCRTSVQVGKIQPNLPNNPERFTRYNIVLGSEAFSSGRHYWEVEVGSKTAWGLGVAQASVNRKDEINLCPEDGFWTLVLRDNGDGTSEYEACTDTEQDSLLYPSKPPRRVGIYLDYGRGEVAFYDAGDMSHLFTFYDAKFDEPVYPYFNPWPIINGYNWEPLTIVSPHWG
uniref:Uncharacterized protein n=1 Tax=Hippocampus comes TaxID=109280 RepID=A0A3Q3DC63_HIPCM